jgi:hypothetical protein
MHYLILILSLIILYNTTTYYVHPSSIAHPTWHGYTHTRSLPSSPQSHGHPPSASRPHPSNAPLSTPCRRYPQHWNPPTAQSSTLGRHTFSDSSIRNHLRWRSDTFLMYLRNTFYNSGPTHQCRHTRTRPSRPGAREASRSSRLRYPHRRRLTRRTMCSHLSQTSRLHNKHSQHLYTELIL